MSSTRASAAKSKQRSTGVKAKAKSTKPLVSFSIDVGKTGNGYYRAYFNAYTKNFGSFPQMPENDLQVFLTLEDLTQAVTNYYNKLAGKL